MRGLLCCVGAAGVLLAGVPARGQCDGHFAPGTGLAGTYGPAWALAPWDPDGAGPLPEQLAIGGYLYGADTVGPAGVYLFDGERFTTLGPALFGGVQTLAVFNGDLICGGGFTRVDGGAPLLGVARWNRQTLAWEQMGAGLNGVYELEVFNGELYAGGYFNSSGSTQLSGVARWDGAVWQPVGPPTLITVNALATYNGQLHAGTSRSAPWNVARWNGSTWDPIGSGSLDAAVWDLEPYESFLVATGSQDNPLRQRICFWNGTQWSCPSGGIQPVAGDRMYAVAGGLNHLWAAGRFVAGGGIGTDRVGRYDFQNSRWQPTNGELDDYVTSLREWNGRLYAGGYFSRVNGTLVSNFARYDGTAWEPIKPGLRMSLRSMALAGGRVYAGESNVAGQRAYVLRREQGGAWSTVGGAANAPIAVLCTYNDQLIAGGDFNSIDGVSIARVARWTGSHWFGLGSGLNGQVLTGVQYQGSLVLGGLFTSAGGQPVSYVAAWNGSQWSSLGQGLINAPDVLCVFNGQLYAGGQLGIVGGEPRADLVRWNGSAWEAVLGFVPTSGVTGMTVMGNELVISGTFSSIEGVPASCIAAWNGTTWRALGEGLDSSANQLVVQEGQLFASGFFTASGSRPIHGVARWDGSEWHAISVAQNDPANGFAAIYALLPHDGVLDVCGNFALAGGTPHYYFARWLIPTADFDHDGDVGTDADIQAFFACLAGNCCDSCGGMDFNGDGDDGTDADIEAFFRVLAGGNC